MPVIETNENNEMPVCECGGIMHKYVIDDEVCFSCTACGSKQAEPDWIPVKDYYGEDNDG